MYRRGDLILASEPFAYAVNLRSCAGKVCDYCIARRDCPKPCPRCKVVRYCSKLCQVSALSDHTQECGPLQEAYPYVPSTTVRLMARILLKLKLKHERDCKEPLPGGRTRSFRDLQSHVEEIQQDATALPQFRATWATLEDFLGRENLPPIEEGLEIYGKVVINAFCMTDEELRPVGQALYLAASVLDHSCDPNAAFAFRGRSITVHATRDFRARDLAEVYICYVDKIQLARDRISALREQYYFTCNCPLCRQALHEGAEILEERWAELTESVHSLQRQLEYTDEADDLRRILERAVGVLSRDLAPNDVSRLEALELAFECCRRLGLHATALAYGTEALDVFKCCFGEYSTRYGIRLLKLGKLLYTMRSRGEADTFLRQASRILSVTHGKQHGVYRELLEYQRCRGRNGHGAVPRGAVTGAKTGPPGTTSQRP